MDFEEALCLGKAIELWFPDGPLADHQLYYDVGKFVCDLCPCRTECIKLGADEEYGMFGGQIPSDRKRGRETPRPKKAITTGEVHWMIPRHIPDTPIPDIRALRTKVMEASHRRIPLDS